MVRACMRTCVHPGLARSGAWSVVSLSNGPLMYVPVRWPVYAARLVSASGEGTNWLAGRRHTFLTVFNYQMSFSCGYCNAVLCCPFFEHCGLCCSFCGYCRFMLSLFASIGVLCCPFLRTLSFYAVPICEHCRFMLSLFASIVVLCCPLLRALSFYAVPFCEHCRFMLSPFASIVVLCCPFLRALSFYAVPFCEHCRFMLSTFASIAVSCCPFLRTLSFYAVHFAGVLGGSVAFYISSRGVGGRFTLPFYIPRGGGGGGWGGVCVCVCVWVLWSGGR